MSQEKTVMTRLMEFRAQIERNKARKASEKPKPSVKLPRARMVKPAEISKNGSFLARDYFPPAKEADEPWTMFVPELNVINSAKAWAKRMKVVALEDGYQDMKKFFKESDLTNDADKRLYDMVQGLLSYEQGKKR